MSGLGYLYPSIRLAHILQANSQSVLVVSTNEHNAILANYGIEHFPVRDSNNRFLDLHGWATPENGLKCLNVVNDLVNRYKPDVIVTSPLAMISFILAEKYKIPLINVGFCEYLFPGKLAGNEVKQWRINKFTETYNSYRFNIGLPPISVSSDSPLVGTKYLLRSVPTLNDDIVLPDQVEYVGDLYFEPQFVHKPLFKFIAASKQVGRRIVYIQIGRLFKSDDVWQNLLKALSQLPISFIVDTGRADYSIQGLTSNFFTSSFIPIGAVKDDIDFVICTGQTTSVISSIIHEKRILAIPHSADSIELTKRLEVKKLALALYESKYINVDNIKNLFSQLNSDDFIKATRNYKQHFIAYTNDVIYDTIKSM